MITKPQTAAQRKAAERARKKALGLVKIEIWCNPNDKEKIKNYISQLNKHHTKSKITKKLLK